MYSFSNRLPFNTGLHFGVKPCTGYRYPKRNVNSYQIAEINAKYKRLTALLVGCMHFSVFLHFPSSFTSFSLPLLFY